MSVHTPVWKAGGKERDMQAIIGTTVTLLILAGLLCLAIGSMVKDKRAGKSLHCGGDCSKCSGHCH